MFWAIGIVGLFGLAVGSFLNVVIYRIGLDDDSNPPPFVRKEGVRVLGTEQDVRKLEKRRFRHSERSEESNVQGIFGDSRFLAWLGMTVFGQYGFGLGGRSYCPHCKTGLKWFELIPVLSFLIQSRKCNSCSKPISWQYPLVELGTAVVFVLITLQYLNGGISF